MEKTTPRFAFRDHQVDALSFLKGTETGIVKAPTGSGKSIIIFEDTKRFVQPGEVVVIVASRLELCAQHFQECDLWLKDTEYTHLMVGTYGATMKRCRRFEKVNPVGSTTRSNEIADRYRISVKAGLPMYIFSTYDSLNRVLDSGIPLSVVYFDEAHNSVDTDNHVAVKRVAENGTPRYFFTATPKMTQSGSERSTGMNNTEVYGDSIFEVSFKEMVEKGYIVPPRLHLQKSNGNTKNGELGETDFLSVKETVRFYEEQMPGVSHKILFCMKGTKTIQNLMNKTQILDWAKSKGYKVLTVDSKNGGFVDGVRVRNFRELLKSNGADESQKLLVFHVQMISEGIDVKGFTGVSFMRGSVDKVFATQTVGRVVRTAGEWKQYGMVTVVLHEDDSTETCELLDTLVRSLLSNGVPIEYLLSEICGSSEDEEVVEELVKKFKKTTEAIDIDWRNAFLLDHINGLSVDEVIDELF